MQQIIIFFAITTLMLPLGYFALKYTFKNSIIFSLSWINLLILYFSSLMYFTAGTLGLIHLLWAIPLASVITGGFYLRIIAKVQKPLIETVTQLSKIAEGDLQIENVKGINHQNNELGMLSENIQKLVLVLKHLVKEINRSSKKLSKSSSLLASNTCSLASDSAKQANSSQNLSTTIDSIAQRVGDNANYAHSSSSLSQDNMVSLRELFNLSEKITQMVNTISDRTKEIEDIAKGTNILALNAAIEAAKSGSSGKGFTVVAAEIRKLAERSTEAVGQIVKLTSNSNELVAKSSELFDVMLPQIEKTSDMVTEISNASNKQKLSIEEVNTSIKELSQIAQNNVSASEDIAFTSKQLKDLSETLKDSLHFFKISDSDTKERMKKAKGVQKGKKIATKTIVSNQKPELELA